jgi:hypothetical protein
MIGLIYMLEEEYPFLFNVKIYFYFYFYFYLSLFYVPFVPGMIPQRNLVKDYLFIFVTIWFGEPVFCSIVLFFRNR